jgi:uncharacterized protein YceH (UPF0502 family)
LEEVEETLNSLISREPESLVVRLSRQPGQKEARVAHLLSGPPSEDVMSGATVPRATSRQNDRERIESLEQNLTDLSEEVQTLREQFAEFKKQFE